MPDNQQDVAIAMPTKPFFVSMLTRDISLVDAILDLVDNCLDGALRSTRGRGIEYGRFNVVISLSGDSFSIEDNCGGIPKDIAKQYAFKMGRELDDDRDSDNETIGMYGVGMKRAIFKMGRKAIIKTVSVKDAFEVCITPEWLNSSSWDPLLISDLGESIECQQQGTRICVTDLYPGVSRQFSNGAFQNELQKALSEHFTVFIQRGLRISVNGTQVEAVRVVVLVPDDPLKPAPYVFEAVIDEVIVSIVVGLNAGKAILEDEDDSLEFERDRSSATAGWTVFCNDRAVIVGEKSRLTGWGDSIPLYHYQFSIITGIVEFRSKHAGKLPVTTTKRALDTSSDIWLQALIRMKEGMRIWINYTNAWKNHPRSDQTQHWENARPKNLRETIDKICQVHGIDRPNGNTTFNPLKRKLIPRPPTNKPASKKVIFSRPTREIETVSKYLFDSYDEKPGMVGDECFQRTLKEAREEDLSHE